LVIGEQEQKQDGEMEEAANTRLNFLKSYLNNMDSQTVRILFIHLNYRIVEANSEVETIMLLV
jgi:hypothetical protein